MSPGLELQQLLHVVYPYTAYVISNCTTRANAELGAGVLVRIGTRLLLATAKHCVAGPIQVGLGSDFPIPGPPTPTRREVLHPSCDLAIVELSPDSPCSACMLEQLYPGSLPDCLHLEAKPLVTAFLVGYPSACRERYHRFTNTTLVQKRTIGTCWTAETEDATTWAYPADAWQLQPDGSRTPSQFPATPEGFSGGGLWGFLPHANATLFNPTTHIKLFALQSSWNSGSRSLTAIPIRKWLQLVANSYTDLQDEIYNRYPQLRP